ncbi:MAG: hypothetical protein AABZ39_16775 [Spirochaetota bacterium]
MRIRTIAFIIMFAVFGITAYSIAITDTPRDAVVADAEGAFRIAGMNYRISLPAMLKGGKCISVVRGVWNKPAEGYSFTIDAPATVYLLVQERGTITTLNGWEKTSMKSVSADGNIRMTDIIYKKDVPAGIVSIPGHDGSDGNKYGMPHTGVVIGQAQSTPSDAVQFGRFMIGNNGFASMKHPSGDEEFSAPASTFVYIVNAAGDTILPERSSRTANGRRYTTKDGYIDCIIDVRSPDRISLLLSATGSAIRAVGFAVGVPESASVLVPGGRNGISYREYDFPGPRRFNWPRRWEAPVVVFEGTTGSAAVWAEDASNRYKTCVLYNEGKVKCVGFETENFAPFTDKRTIVTPMWHVGVFNGGYKSALAPFRKWMIDTYRPERFYKEGDRYANIRSLIRVPSLLDSGGQYLQNITIAKEIASRIDPSKTLFWTVSWYRLDEGMQKRPDPPPAQNGYAEQNAGTRALGYINFSYIASYSLIAEKSKIFDEARPYFFINEKTGNPEGWFSDGVPSYYASGLCPALKRSHSENMRQLIGPLGVDVISFEQTSATWNSDGAFIGGKSGIDGIIDIHETVLADNPKAVLAAEGMADILTPYDRFHQTHPWEGVYNFNDLRPGPLLAHAHPISSYIFEPFSRKIPFLDVPLPFGSFYWQHMKPAYITWGTLPGLLITSTNLISRYGYAVTLDEMRVWQDVGGKAAYCERLTDTKRLTLSGARGKAYFSVSDTGYDFVVENTSGGKTPVYSVISNTAERALPGMGIPNWPAWRGTTALGLDSARYYLASRLAKQPSLRAYISGMPGRNIARYYTSGKDAIAVLSGQTKEVTLSIKEPGVFIHDGTVREIRAGEEHIRVARWCAFRAGDDAAVLKDSLSLPDCLFSMHAVEGNSGFIQSPTSAVEKPEYSGNPPIDFAGKKADGIWLVPLHFGAAVSSFLFKTGRDGRLDLSLELCLAREKGISGITYEVFVDGERTANGAKRSSGWERLTISQTAVKAGYHLVEIIVDADGPWNADIAFVSGQLSLR